MTEDHYCHCMKVARELSIRFQCIIVLSIWPSGLWDFTMQHSKARALYVFDQRDRRNRWMDRSKPYFIARDGVIMAQRRCEEVPA